MTLLEELEEWLRKSERNEFEGIYLDNNTNKFSLSLKYYYKIGCCADDCYEYCGEGSTLEFALRQALDKAKEPK